MCQVCCTQQEICVQVKRAAEADCSLRAHNTAQCTHNTAHPAPTCVSFCPTQGCTEREREREKGRCVERELHKGNATIPASLLRMASCMDRRHTAYTNLTLPLLQNVIVLLGVGPARVGVHGGPGRAPYRIVLA